MFVVFTVSRKCKWSSVNADTEDVDDIRKERQENRFRLSNSYFAFRNPGKKSQSVSQSVFSSLLSIPPS